MQLRLAFKIHGMDCAEEVIMLRRELGPVVGGEDRLAFDILNGKMTLAPGPTDIAARQIIARLCEYRWLK
jgi:Cd2+/Zn2+-exporting ATPase